MNTILIILLTTFVILAPFAIAFALSGEMSFKDFIFLILSSPIIFVSLWLVIICYPVYWAVGKYHDWRNGSRSAA